MKTFEKLYREAITIGQSVYSDELPPKSPFKYGDIVFIGGNIEEFKATTLKKAQSHYGQIGNITGYKARSMSAPYYVVHFSDGEMWPYIAHFIRGPFTDVVTATKYSKTPEQSVPLSVYTNYKNTGDKISQPIEAFISSFVTEEPVLFTKLDTPIETHYDSKKEKETTLYTRKTELIDKIQRWDTAEEDSNMFRIFRTNKDRTGNLATEPYKITLPDIKVPYELIHPMSLRYGAKPKEQYFLYYYSEHKKIDFHVHMWNKIIDKQSLVYRSTQEEIIKCFYQWNSFVKATKDPSIPNIKELLTLLAGKEADKMKSILATSGLYAPGEVKFRDIFSEM